MGKSNRRRGGAVPAAAGVMVALGGVFASAAPALAAPSAAPTVASSSLPAPSAQPDIPDTAAALAAVQAADAAVDRASDRLAQALAAQHQASAAAAAARDTAAQAEANAKAQQGALDAYAHWLYVRGPMAQTSPLVQALLGTSTPADTTDAVVAAKAVGDAQAQQVQQALRAQDAARAARTAAAEAASIAKDALSEAGAAKARLVTAAAQAHDVLAAAQQRDASLAAYLSASQGEGLHAAAVALTARAVATEAASAATFTGLPDDAARIAAADNALLEQVAGHLPAPSSADGAAPGSPALVRAVMGPAVAPAPVDPPGRTGRSSASVALAPAGQPLSGLGSPGVGLTGLSASGLVAAPPQKADGVNVAPEIPAPTGARHAAPTAAAVAVAEALRQVGKPYVWAASGPDTYDCSGLALWSWGAAGVALPHSSEVQWTMGTPVDDPTLLLPGDLVLFGTASTGDIHHVGIYLGAGFMVAAPRSGEYVQVQRVSDLHDYAGGVRL